MNAALVVFCALALLGQREWTVLPLGDSITEGSAQFHCYREPLSKKLSDAGLKVRFVGSRGGAGLRHEGYGGKTVEFLAENIERLYTANPADVILLHAGHNHFADEKPVAGIIAATEKIIAAARRINPRAVVLLAQVIPSGKLPKYSYIPELNAELARLAARLHQREQPVIIVDQASGFDWQTDTIADHVHPNQQGAAKMAAQWFDALRPLLSRSTPGS